MAYSKKARLEREILEAAQLVERIKEQLERAEEVYKSLLREYTNQPKVEIDIDLSAKGKRAFRK